MGVFRLKKNHKNLNFCGGIYDKNEKKPCWGWGRKKNYFSCLRFLFPFFCKGGGNENRIPPLWSIGVGVVGGAGSVRGLFGVTV